MMRSRTTTLLPSQPARRQQGAALIVSLMILIVITLLGISAMRNTTLDERMAGNMHDLQLAFQAAETALREGEEALSVATLPVFNNSGGYFEPDTDLWRTIDWDGANVIEADADHLPEVISEPPKYYLEELPASPLGSSIEAGAALTAGNYRITARGVGGSSNSVVILQATFRR